MGRPKSTFAAIKIRAELHVGGPVYRVILAPRPEERIDHLAMKLAAVAMFRAHEPIVEPSSDHPALSGLEFKPDVCTLDLSGRIAIWIECGAVTLNKLDKMVRRMPETRFVVLKSSLHEARRLREEVDHEIRQSARIEIWTWPDGTFLEWVGTLAEKTEIFGEASEKTFNFVVNSHAYAVDLVAL